MAVVVDVIGLEGIQGVEKKALLLAAASLDFVAYVLLATQTLVQVQILDYVLELVSLNPVA